MLNPFEYESEARLEVQCSPRERQTALFYVPARLDYGLCPSVVTSNLAQLCPFLLFSTILLLTWLRE